MKITAVETFALSNRRLLVKISTTTAGLVGWGEATLEGWVRPVETTVNQMAGHLVGQDPRRVTHHWQVLARGGFYRGGSVLQSALAGIDQALWDIKGRALNAPVHELLGGAARDAIRIYAHAGHAEHTGDPERAASLVSHGYTMMKVAVPGQVRFTESREFVDGLVEDLRTLRERVGGGVDIAIDLHGKFSTVLTRQLLPRLEEFHLAFVEEPLRPEHSDQIGRITASTPIPIATGERLYSREEFLRVLPQGVAIVQPDLAHAGGITECFRIGTLAESFDAQVAPHCPLGPVALAACLQIDAALPNFHSQETVIEAHDPAARYGLELLADPKVLTAVAGHIPLLTGPGLGIDVDEDAVRAAVVDGELPPGSPVWYHAADGSFAEW